MSTLNSSFGSRFGLEYLPTSFMVRMGRREMMVCRDFRKRFYAVNPIIECDTGVQAKFRAFGLGVALSYGKDLRSGRDAVFIRVLEK